MMMKQYKAVASISWEKFFIESITFSVGKSFKKLMFATDAEIYSFYEVVKTQN